MDYTSFQPQAQAVTGLWHESYAAEASDASSIDGLPSARRQSTSDSSTTRLPSHQGRRRSSMQRRAQASGGQERARERISELEQRIRELESSASETTARATIKVLQTRVRDLEAEVDCLNMRLEQAELVMNRARSGEPAVPSNLFGPIRSTSISGSVRAVSQLSDSYVTSLPTSSHTTTLPYAQSNAQAILLGQSDSFTVPRSSPSLMAQPLINWNISTASKDPTGMSLNDSVSPQRPLLPAQQTAIWRGAV